MVWVIRYIVSILIKHDAWDSIVEIPPTWNQLKSNTCKAKEPCMLISPKDQNLAMQWTSSTSALLWIFSRQLEHPRNTLFSHFTRVQANQKFQHTLHSFSLKERARKLSWVHEFTHQKKDKSSISFFFLLSQRKLED